jgi:uncharacterized membrane protein YhiD involved in acid resistance
MASRQVTDGMSNGQIGWIIVAATLLVVVIGVNRRRRQRPAGE